MNRAKESEGGSLERTWGKSMSGRGSQIEMGLGVFEEQQREPMWLHETTQDAQGGR